MVLISWETSVIRIEQLQLYIMSMIIIHRYWFCGRGEIIEIYLRAVTTARRHGIATGHCKRGISHQSPGGSLNII